MPVQGIDRSEILIRPYKKVDREQVINILLEGFSPVGYRLFKASLFQRAVYLKVALSSSILALLTVWVFIPFWHAPGWSTIQPILVSMPKTTIDFLSKQNLVSVLSLQILSPAFLTAWMIWAAALSGFMTITIYNKCVKGMAGSYAAESMEDDMSDLTGYYQSDIPFPKTEFYEKHRTIMSQIEAKHRTKQQFNEMLGKKHKTKNYSQFWVACLRSHPQLVMGCGALDDVGFHADYLAAKSEVSAAGGSGPHAHETPDPKELELRRMSVQESYRRLGILSMLVDTMKTHALQHGFDKITLSTTTFQVEAIGGYKKAGFQEQRVLTVAPNFSIWFGKLDLKKK